MNEENFLEIFSHLEKVKMEEQWITTDVLPNRENEKWFNVMLRKF